jgi:hypothetical protein
LGGDAFRILGYGHVAVARDAIAGGYDCAGLKTAIFLGFTAILKGSVGRGEARYSVG